MVTVRVALMRAAPAGGSGAPREHTGVVHQHGRLVHPVGDLVGIDPDMVVQVDHRLHDHGGVGGPAPGPDLLDGDQRPGVLQPAQTAQITEATVHEGGVGEVDVEHHPPRLTPRLLRRGRVGVGGEVEGLLGAGEVPHRGRPADVQRVGGPEGLEVLRAGTDGGIEVEGVGDVELTPHRRRPAQGGVGGVDVEAPPVRGRPAAVLGLLGHEPRDGLLDEPVEDVGPDLVRHGRDVGIDEAAASRDRWIVARAMRRAFHATRSPRRPALQTRGRRYLSSTASPR